MLNGRITEWGVALLAFSAPLAHGQGPQTTGPSQRMVVSSPGTGAPFDVHPGEIVREIDDPHTSERWLLMRDPSRPGGPGLLLLVASARTELRQAALGAATPAPIIHAGDRVVVEEDSAVVDVRLEAVAMGPAVLGAGFKVRLSIGGNVVRAVALAPERAAFLEKREGPR